MSRREPFLFFVLLLFVGGLGTALYRHESYYIPFWPGTQQTVWQVEARVEYVAQGGASQVWLTLPPEQSGFRVIGQSWASPGFGFEISSRGRQQRAHWTKRDVLGEQVLFYKLDIVQDPGHVVEPSPPGEPEFPSWDEPYQTAALQILQSVMPVSADAYSLAQQLSFEMNRAGANQNLSLLLDRYRPPELMASLLNWARVPARTVQVLELEDGRRRQGLRDLVQVWDEDDWRLFDPRLGLVEDARLLLWQTATPAVLEVLGGSRSGVSFSIISQSRPATTLIDQSPPGYALSLYDLPIAEQSMFKLIMLLPVGALVVVVMRILVGLKTSGTFMPVLIALAFLQTELVPGVTSFVVVVAIGLVIRSYLSSLNLLLVSRIATLVVVVIGIITFFSLLSYRLNLMGGLTITFFPMIILAWTIERMSITWEELGPREVAVQGGGSLLVAVLAFLVMDQPLARHLAFNFPELNLCVLALILLLGRYTGYRLLELHRFAVVKP